jgi:uncharacterized protein YggE
MIKIIGTGALLSTLICASACNRQLNAPAPAVASSDSSGIFVGGQCLRKVLQDRGAVTVVSTAVHPTPKEASTKVIEAHEKVKEAVKALNLPDFAPETEAYSVEEEREYKSDKWIKKGFRATMATRFETSDITRLGEIIGTASSAGAERVGNLGTFVSPEKMKAEREACLETATQNAVAKAARLAAGGGVNVGELLQVTENMGYGSRALGGPGSRGVMAMAAAGLEGDASVPTPSVQAKAEDVSVEVTARFAVRR